MTANKSWIEDYEGFDGGTVLLGDDEPCRIYGRGNIHMKLHDGAVKTLTDVRYVPALRRNLISVGVLDELGYTIKAEAGCIKVTRGSLSIMKEYRRNGVYPVDGCTVVGLVSAAKGNLNKSELWHKRLEHVSERGLQELAKPSKQHWNAFKWILKYVRGTLERGLMFGANRSKEAVIVGYVNSDFSGCLDSRKSLTG